MSDTGITTTSSFMSIICAPHAAGGQPVQGRASGVPSTQGHPLVRVPGGLPGARVNAPDGSLPWTASVDRGGRMEYLVTMTTRVPDDVTEADVAEVRAREAAHTRELARAGRVRRLWPPPLQPGEWRTLGLFVADGSTELEQTLAAMPLRVWRTDEVTPLGAHPNDPGRDRVTLDVNSSAFFTTFVLTVPPGTSA